MSLDETTTRPSTGRSTRSVLVAGLLLAFLLAGFVSGYASGSPDGLEKVAEDEGFLQSAQDSSFASSPLADYALSGIEDERLAGGLAGVLGVALTIVVGTLLFWAVSRVARRRRSAGSGA